MKIKMLSAIMALFLFGNLVTAQEKIVISTAEDLPKHSYQLENRSASDNVQSEEAIEKIAAMIKVDIEADLEKYDIKDRASLKMYYTILRFISIIEEDYKKALDYIGMERELADKESEKITRGMETEALLRAAMAEKTFEAEILSDKIATNLANKMAIKDFSVIQESIESAKGQSEIISENLIIGFLQGELQKAIDNNEDEIPGDLVSSLLNYYYTLNFYIPYKDIYNTAYVAALDKYVKKVEKVDIWEARDITLDDKQIKEEVIIGVWDTGVDTEIFKEKNLWVNENEKADGKDTDGNGFIDDLHGLAYNLQGVYEPYYLLPDADTLENIKEYQERIKGIMDLQANIDSEDATEVKKYLASLAPEDVNPAIEGLSMYSIYAHGTHVAGISLAGNPQAKVLVGRMTADYKSIPDKPEEKVIRQWAKSYGEMVAYFSEHGVRVVNMSWGESYESILRELELNGVGENDEDRKALAKKYFDIKYKAFKAALEGAPEIVFICAAGNSNDDVDFTGDYPSSLNLPNLMTVGAVDIEGKKTGFTTEGESVDVYANGYEVESYVPGGDRIKFSGTSMASPQVANLAGKILAVNPDLSPEQVFDIIKKTATQSEEDEKVLLVHPINAVEMAGK